MQMKLKLPTVVFCLLMMRAADAFGCFLGPRPPQSLVAGADVIVRAQVLGQFEPDLVTFMVLEHLKGDRVFVVTTRGRMTDRPDLSWTPVPPGVSRRGIRGCEHGLTYQRGGEYLLMLKVVDGALTPYWAPGVTNEQLKGPHDEWLEWVKQEFDAKPGIVRHTLLVEPSATLVEPYGKKQRKPFDR